MAFMYVLGCADGSFYVGSTTDLAARMAQHQAGLGAAYTRRAAAVPFVWCTPSSSPDVATAFHWEKRVQGWSRKKRLALIEGRVDLLPGLSRRRGVRPRG